MTAQGRRGGGRAARRAARQRRAPRIGTRRTLGEIPLYELLDAEGLELIHRNSMTILEEVGIEFRDAEALELWRKAGAEVDGERVRIPAELALETLALAPSQFTQHARNPERSVVIGGRHSVMAPCYGSPFVLDFEGERRYGTLADLENFIKLAYLAPALDHSGGIICEPVDVAVPKRHLDIVERHITLSDKPYMGIGTGSERARDIVAMSKLVFGEAFVEEHPVTTTVINCNSPLVWDATMLGALKVYARHNQALLVSPFIMAGAMAPASTAGAIAQLNAEAVAGLAFAQIVRPGAPVVHGSFVTTVSMRSGAPMSGTPEPAMMIYVAAQLARRYGLPVRTGGMLTGSKLPDAQAAYESVQTMIPTLMAGTNFVLHAAGWLEAGLTASYAKMVLDMDQIAMLTRFAGGLDLSEEAQALDAVREVGPGGHYLGAAHTRRHYQSAFYTPVTADNESFERWQEEGGHDAAARALEIAKQMLAEYEPPPLDPAVAEALGDFVARRKRELPDAVT